MPDNDHLIDLFDTSLERMAAGESIDDILADYPDVADELGALLQTGQLVYQAQLTESALNSEEVDSAKAATRQRLENRFRKPQDKLFVMQKPKRRPHRTWMLASFAAGIALVIGIGIGIVGMNLNSQPGSNVPPVATQVAQQNEFALTATQLIDEITATAVVAINATQDTQLAATDDINEFALTATAVIMDLTRTVQADLRPTISLTGTLNPLQQTLVAEQRTQAAPQNTPVASFPTGTSVGQMTATAVVQVVQNVTATADLNFRATQNANAQQTAVVYATERSGSVATMTPAPSQTSLPTTTVTMKATPAATQPPGTATPIPQIVSTSVASMDVTPLNLNTVEMTATALAPLVSTPEPQPTSVAVLATIHPTSTVSPTQRPTQDFTGVQLDPLRAGEIDDNAEWDRYTEYRRNYLSQFGDQVVDVDVRNRRIIQVIDRNGMPVMGALVQILANDRVISETLTYATGMTQFFPRVDESIAGVDVFSINVAYENQRAFASLDLNRPGDVHVVEMDFQQQPEPVKLDVVFLIDATGSMGDEIAQLQNNITVIANQVDTLSANVDTRYGLVTYRDYPVPGETITLNAFTDDVTRFQAALNEVYADGTNNPDWDEALNEGLYRTLTQMEWRGQDTIKLVFLVADARPHLNHPQETHIYTEEALRATRLGIKIHPIASSGLEHPGEYMFRQIAQLTMGHFLFLTYDSGDIAINTGVAGDDRPDLQVGEPENAQGVGDYDVTQLDELVLRLITDEVAYRLAIAESANRGESIPVDSGQDSFELTATQLIRQLTQTAESQLPEGEYLEGITADDLDAASRSVFITGLVLGGVVIGGIMLIAFGLFLYRRRGRKRG